MILILALAHPALAQDIAQETPPPPPPPKGFTKDFTLLSEWHEYNNLDFRRLDETSDQSILDSDDRGEFAYTSFRANMGYAVDDAMFNVGVEHRGLWGGDQIGNVNQYGAWVFVNSLSGSWVPGTPAEGEHQFKVTVGRQYFSLGANGDARDFAFADIIDGLRVDIPLGHVGQLELLPASIVDGTLTANDVYFYDYIGQGAPSPYNFRGDLMTRRYGGELVFDGLAKGLDARAYGFYTDIGANGSGSDISYSGELGNFSDNDWVANFGARVQYTAGVAKPWVELDVSNGIDRKELLVTDVDCNGIAGAGGIHVLTGDEDSGLDLATDVFYAMGPLYAKTGLQYSHGYVSMKGQTVGGLITGRFLGWRPSPYVGYTGVEDEPNQPERKAGTMVAHAGATYNLAGPVGFGAEYWFMLDTGGTYFNQATIDTVDAPYGYSREQFAAEARFGKVLGQEIDGTVTVAANQHWTFYVNGGVLLPGAYYSIVIDRVAGDQLGSPDPVMAWAANGGARLEF